MQFLFFDGLFTGCYSEIYPDQDWIILPKVPFYIGDFVKDTMSGRGQFFWPNGAPLFKGSVLNGQPDKGFVFDERSVCHGHFRFAQDRTAEVDGTQPDDVGTDGICTICGATESLMEMGKVLKPCGHGIACESCVQTSRECPYCHIAVEGIMRIA